MRPVRQGIRLAGVVALLLLGTACGHPTATGGDGSGEGNASASCAAPYVNDLPPSGPFHGPVPTVAPGDSLTVYGHWYTTTCNDTGGHDALAPMPPVRLTLRLPGGSTVDLGRFVPSGTDMGFSTVVHVPEGTPAGVARIRDDQQYPSTFEFRVGPG